MAPLPLTVSQAAEMLGIGRSMVYELMSTGELESWKLAKKCRRIPYESALDYVRRLRQEGVDGSGPPAGSASSTRTRHPPIREAAHARRAPVRPELPCPQGRRGIPAPKAGRPDAGHVG